MGGCNSENSAQGNTYTVSYLFFVGEKKIGSIRICPKQVIEVVSPWFPAGRVSNLNVAILQMLSWTDRIIDSSSAKRTIKRDGGPTVWESSIRIENAHVNSVASAIMKDLMVADAQYAMSRVTSPKQEIEETLFPLDVYFDVMPDKPLYCIYRDASGYRLKSIGLIEICFSPDLKAILKMIASNPDFKEGVRFVPENKKWKGLTLSTLTVRGTPLLDLIDSIVDGWFKNPKMDHTSDALPYMRGGLVGNLHPTHFAQKCMHDFATHTTTVGSQVLTDEKRAKSDAVNHPAHYKVHPSGVECIRITEHFMNNVGNAIKYLWRAGFKSPNAIEDLEKAKKYVEFEIERLKRAN